MANLSFSCEAWKCRLVGTRKDVSREPWEMASGRREAEDLGVETPVWGPVPVPYMADGRREVGWVSQVR